MNEGTCTSVAEPVYRVMITSPFVISYENWARPVNVRSQAKNQTKAINLGFLSVMNLFGVPSLENIGQPCGCQTNGMRGEIYLRSGLGVPMAWIAFDGLCHGENEE